MQIYYYCSYEGSPAGYHIGKVETSSYDIDLQEPSCDKINPFIQQCFENGIVRGGYGKIPESADTYFLLKKKFTATKEKVKYYINFAIVTDEWTEFEALMQKENTETEIINNYLESIKPDTLFYFGYRIQTEKIKKISSCGYGSIFNINHDYLNMVKQKDAVFIETSTGVPDMETLEKNLQLRKKIDEKGIERCKIAEKLFCYKKKTTIYMKSMIIILVIFLGIIWIMSQNFLENGGMQEATAQEKIELEKIKEKFEEQE